MTIAAFVLIFGNKTPPAYCAHYEDKINYLEYFHIYFILANWKGIGCARNCD